MREALALCPRVLFGNAAGLRELAEREGKFV